MRLVMMTSLSIVEVGTNLTDMDQQMEVSAGKVSKSDPINVPKRKGSERRHLDTQALGASPEYGLGSGSTKKSDHNTLNEPEEKDFRDGGSSGSGASALSPRLPPMGGSWADAVAFGSPLTPSFFPPPRIDSGSDGPGLYPVKPTPHTESSRKDSNTSSIIGSPAAGDKGNSKHSQTPKWFGDDKYTEHRGSRKVAESSGTVKVRVMTFNCENLIARYRFHAKQPAPDDGFTINDLAFSMQDAAKRDLTAMALRRCNADLVALQEIESGKVLDRFNAQFLRGLGYAYTIVINAHDSRFINVGLLSRYPIVNIRTHKDERDPSNPDLYLFSRDLLEVDVSVDGAPLTLYITHLKAMTIDGRGETHRRRWNQVMRIRDILEDRWKAFRMHGNYVILGDLNDHDDEDSALRPLLDHPSLVNVMEKLPEAERWTHHFATSDTYAQLDYIIVSRSLWDRNPDAMPVIMRMGLPLRAKQYTGPRLAGVGEVAPKSSDHTPVYIDLNLRLPASKSKAITKPLTAATMSDPMLHPSPSLPASEEAHQDEEAKKSAVVGGKGHHSQDFSLTKNVHIRGRKGRSRKDKDRYLTADAPELNRVVSAPNSAGTRRRRKRDLKRSNSRPPAPSSDDSDSP